MKRIVYNHKNYYYTWSFSTEGEAKEKADMISHAGYHTKVIRSEHGLRLYLLYTSPQLKQNDKLWNIIVMPSR